MGTVSQRKNKDGTIRYRAEIRIAKEGQPKFSESKTFSKKSLAESWIKKREAEIELNPELLHKSDKKSIRVTDAIEKYIAETNNSFGRTWYSSLRLIGKTPFGLKYLDKVGREDFLKYAQSRLNGTYPNRPPIKPQTLNHEIATIRSLLKHAENVWGYDVKLDEFDKVVRGLSYSRQLTRSNQRTRLPTSDELQALTTYFYTRFMRRTTPTPNHLIMWFAIYTARRQEELTRLDIREYHDGFWTVKDIKNPKGSKGNHKTFKVADKAQALIPLFFDENLREIQRTGLKRYNEHLLISSQAKVIGKTFGEACKMLGIDDLHFHDLRHEASTRLAEQGLTIPQMQQITLHDSWSSLQRYVNMKPRKTVLDFDEAMRVAIASNGF